MKHLYSIYPLFNKKRYQFFIFKLVIQLSLFLNLFSRIKKDQQAKKAKITLKNNEGKLSLI